MKSIEKFGWFILALLIILVAVTAISYFGHDVGTAYGVVLSVFVAVMFAEVMGLIKK